MSLEEKNLCMVEYFYFNEPENVEFRVLQNFYSIKEVPWPMVLLGGLCHRISIMPNQIDQKILFGSDNFLLIHSLWTCDCGPNHNYIHLRASVFCSVCERTINNFILRHNYWHEIFPYEIKEYEFDERMAEKYIQQHFELMDMPSAGRFAN